MGRGTTFHVHLPRCEDAAPSSTSLGTAIRQGSGQTIMVVDDEEPLVELMDKILIRLGYQPVCFTSAREALACFATSPERFSALITDERMPDVSGGELVHEVRMIRGALPVLLVSGNPPTEDWPAADRPNRVLRKPISMVELAERSADVLDQESRTQT